MSTIQWFPIAGSADLTTTPSRYTYSQPCQIKSPYRQPPHSINDSLVCFSSDMKASPIPPEPARLPTRPFPSLAPGKTLAHPASKEIRMHPERSTELPATTKSVSSLLSPLYQLSSFPIPSFSPKFLRTFRPFPESFSLVGSSGEYWIIR